MRLVRMYYMPVNETGAIAFWPVSWMPSALFWRFLSFFGDALSRIFNIFKNEYQDRQ